MKEKEKEGTIFSAHAVPGILRVNQGLSRRGSEGDGRER